MPSSLATENKSFIGPWLFDCSQRITTQDPANVGIEAGAEEKRDIARPTSPPSANALHHVPEAIIEEDFASVTQRESRVNANGEEPLVVGSYPVSPVCSAIVLNWEDAEEVPQLEPRQQHESQSRPQGQLQNATPKGTGPSSIIVEASEGSKKSTEDSTSNVDADSKADVDLSPTAEATAGPITAASAPLDPGLLIVPGISAVPQPLNAPVEISASLSAALASGATIDARLTLLDKALVDLWVRNLPRGFFFTVFTLDYRATSYVCRSRTARHSPTMRCSLTALVHSLLVSTPCRPTFCAPCVVWMT